MLHIIGGGEVEKIGHSVLQQREAGPEDIKAGFAAVDGRGGMADKSFNIGDAVGFLFWPGWPSRKKRRFRPARSIRSRRCRAAFPWR